MEKTRKENSLFVRRTWQRVMAIILSVFMALSFTPAPAVHAASNNMVTQDILTFGTAKTASFTTDEYTDDYASYNIVHIYKDNVLMDNYFDSIVLERQDIQIANIYIKTKSDTPAGKYSFKFYKKSNESEEVCNYFIGSFTIDPMPVSISLKEGVEKITKEYSDEMTSAQYKSNLNFTYTADSEFTTALENLEFTSGAFATNAAPSDAAYAVTKSNSENNSNYLITNDIPSVTVVKKPLSNLTFTVADVEYNGEAFTEDQITKTWKKGDTVITDTLNTNVDYSFETGVTVKDVLPESGTYNITATAKTDSYYTGSKSATFKVTPRPITSAEITVAVSENNKTYNKGPQSPTVVVKDGNNTLTKDTDYTITNYVQTNANTYALTVNGIGNYSSSSVLTDEFVISKADIVDVTMNSVGNWTYGDKTEAITPSVTRWNTTDYPGTSITYKYKKIKNSDGNEIDNPTTVDIVGTIPKNLAAGTYQLWAEIDDATDSGNDNYNKATLDPVTFVISAKPVNITLGNIEKFYGDSITSTDYTFTINTPSYNDAPAFAGLDATGIKATDNDYGGDVVINDQVQSHAFVGQYSEDGNYVISGITNGTVTRNPIAFADDTTRATITLSASSFEYNGEEQKPTVTFIVKKYGSDDPLTLGTDYEVGIYNSQDATETVTPINAGTYYVKVSAKANSGKITGEKWLQFNITKATLTLTYAGIDSTYNPNTTLYNMNDKVPNGPTVTVSTGQVPTFASLLAEGKVVYAQATSADVGNQALTFGYLGDDGSFVAYSSTNNALFNEATNNNYTIEFAASNVSISKANVSIEVTNMPTSWQYLDDFTLPTINVYVGSGTEKASVNDQVTLNCFYQKKTGENTWSEWSPATLAEIKALGVGDYKLKITTTDKTTDNINNLIDGTTTTLPDGTTELQFSVLSKQIDIRIQNSTKKYLNRDELTYKAFKKVIGGASSEDSWVEMTPAELEKYFVDGKILLGRSDENDATGEDVGTHTIDLYSVTWQDKAKNNVTVTLENGTLTIEPLDLAAEGEGAKLLINVEPENNDNWVMDSKGRMMYLYDGQKHRPQMEERDLQVSWKNSQKQKGVLGYYTKGASGAYHYVLVPEKDYIISFTDEAGNQVSNPTNAGKYFITITNSNGSNNIINSYLVQEFEILPIVYYVDYQNEGSADVIKKTYDGTTTFGEFTVKSAKYGNEDIIEAANDPTKYDYTEVTSGTTDWNLLPTTGTSASANVGTYRYDAVDADKKMNIDTSAFEEVYGKKNFKIEVEDSFTITKADATVTPDDATKTYGDDDPGEFTYKATGLVDGEELEDIVVTRVAGEDVGYYSITASNTDGKNTNYNITCDPGEFTITPKAITVTANNASKSYGAADPALSYTADGLVGRDVLKNITVKRDAGENAGTYAINVSGDAKDNPNYDITYKKGTFTINKAAASTTPSAANIKTTKATGSSKDASISGVNSSMEYSTDGGKTWTSVPAGATSISGLGAGTVLVRTKGDANHNPSNATSVTIEKKASQSAPSPTAIKANAASIGSSNGTITGVNDTMEYSTDGGKTWKSVPKGATSITGLSAGIVQIRKKATANSAASAATTVVINSYSSKYKNEWRSGQWYDSNGSTSYKPKGTWKKNSTGWWYEDSSGWYPKAQWQKIDGQWYYFNASGYMASSEWVDGYWLDSDGAWRYSPRGSWKHDGTGWWYQDSSGWYAHSQWQKIDATWYYFDADGHII